MSKCKSIPFQKVKLTHSVKNSSQKDRMMSNVRPNTVHYSDIIKPNGTIVTYGMEQGVTDNM